MAKEVFLPVLHWFDAKNSFSGSCGDFRFMAKPNVVMATAKEVDFAASSIHCEYWHGPYCYEKSEMEGAADFPMSEEGRLAMKAWLEEHI
jgi:hypothetical protein